jgi:hypothetical protein
MTSNAYITQKSGNSNRWEDWANLLLGAWLFVSPWVLQFVVGTGSNASAAWNAWISGTVIAVIAVAALLQSQQWKEWANIVVGIWVAISPWVLGYTSLTTATSNAVIVGILTVCLAGWELYDIAAMTRSGARA